MGFGNKQLKRPQFKQVGEVIWEVDTSFKHGMRVPIRIYAMKKLLDEMDLEVFDQAANAAMMPGIQKYSFVFSDGHSGYGVPVGWCGAFDVNEGVISPGAIGFDENCVHPDTRILSEYGYYKKIKDMKNFYGEKLLSLDLKKGQKKVCEPIMFLKKRVKEKVLRIRTKTGEEILVTKDHPLFNGKEMVEASQLSVGDKVVINPFIGVEYEEPKDIVVVDRKKIEKIVGKRKKIINELKQRGLLPLKLNSDKFPILAKLVGFMTGDGWIGYSYSKKRKMNIWQGRVIGKKEDLEEIKKDLERLGYKARLVKRKRYQSRIRNKNGERIIDGFSLQLYIPSQSLCVLLHSLGVPTGNKSRTPFALPKWLEHSPLWLKRLYLAGLFGAEMSKPIVDKNGYSFAEPAFSQNKINYLEKENMNFMLGIINLLAEFGVNVNKIYRYDSVINSSGEYTHKLILKISSKPKNLISLWGKIGFEYSKEKKILSSLALAYLKYKINVAAKKAVVATSGNTLLKIKASEGLMKFDEFVQASKIYDSEFLLDEIESIEEMDYDGFVYDLTMNDIDHNFIANSIVSHNCGMRLIKTNLTLKDVKPKVKELTDLLFKMVPAGVGATAYQEPKEIANIPEGKFKEIVEIGVKWAVDNGYAWKQDLERIEEYGGVKYADFSKVSKEAYKRGKSQIGTLGSGNHYLEIQVIDQVFNEEIAHKWGLALEKDQICVMVHCGSRGFGHQICTDYLSIFLKAMKKYGINLPDQQLACAPFQSQEGQDFLGAMGCAINFAFVNRQLITYQVRRAFEMIFKKSAEEMEMEIIYDVAHNTAKLEEHDFNGKRKLIVHRKGATRSFGPGNKELSPLFRETGQPVIVGGSMETGSFLCVGTKKAEEETFGTTLHGSGRTMSRTKAKHMFRGEVLQKKMLEKGIYVKATTMSGLAEEAGSAYKDINEVVESMHRAGISLKVLRLRPIANVKG
jgi:tRNA-splicing ligase RtcB